MHGAEARLRRAQQQGAPHDGDGPSRRAPGSAAGETAPGGLGRFALLRGVAALRVGRALSAVALEQSGVMLVAIRAAIMRLGFAFLGPVGLDNHGTPRCPPLFVMRAARGARTANDRPARPVSVYARVPH